MAIFDLYPGVEVNITIDGVALPEYDDDEEEAPKPGPVAAYQASKTVTKYIESVSDKEFAIEVKVNPGYVMNCGSLTVSVFIDGQRLNSRSISKRSCPRHFIGDTAVQTLKLAIDGTHVAIPNKPGHQLLKKYKFSKILTSADDDKLRDIKEDSKRMDKVGEITVVFHRCSEPTAARKPSSRQDFTAAIANVHEKALKGQAKTHTTSLGSESIVRNGHVNSKKLDGNDYPQAIFRFKYRSRDALKSLLIIERTPSPEPEIILISASPARIVKPEFVKREGFRAVQEINANGGLSVKRERDEGGAGSSRKKRKSHEDITIDLTEDSDDDNIICLN